MNQREKEALLTRLQRLHRFSEGEAKHIAHAAALGGDPDQFMRGVTTAFVIYDGQMRALLSFVAELDPGKADEYLKLIANAEVDEKKAAQKAAQAEASAYKHEAKASKTKAKRR